MKALILARTRMHGSARCHGAIAFPELSPIRLLTDRGNAFDDSSQLQVNQLWDLAFEPLQEPIPPHVEDVLVKQMKFIRAVDPDRVKEFILERLEVWSGGVDGLFGVDIGVTGNGNCYVSKQLGVPHYSTGFWRPDRDLVLRDDGRHYDYRDFQWGTRGLSFVGEQEPLPRITQGTLVRISLARWWRPDEAENLEKRCYLQVSGWWN